MEPQALLAVVVLGFVGLMVLISKIFTKLWLYVLLLSPSWSITIFDIIESIVKGEPIAFRALNLLFILAPIDQYVISDKSLFLFGAVLLGIWSYIIFVSCTKLLGGLGLPLAPWIIWLLGKGLPNTMQILSIYLPSWLTAYSGLPLITLASVLLGLAYHYLFRRRKRKS